MHTGELRYSFICDIFRDGEYHLFSDGGALAETYALDNDGGNGSDDNGSEAKSFGIIVGDRVDEQPMGSVKT